MIGRFLDESGSSSGPGLEPGVDWICVYGQNFSQSNHAGSLQVVHDLSIDVRFSSHVTVSHYLFPYFAGLDTPDELSIQLVTEVSLTLIVS